MLDNLPASLPELLDWNWPAIKPYYDELIARPLNSATVREWLADWSQLTSHVVELQERAWVATTLNTADEAAASRHQRFLDEIFPGMQAGEQVLRERLLASGLQPEGFAMPLRNMRAETELFREANVPLLAQLKKLNNAYDQVIGAQVVTWNGEERTLYQMLPIYESADREQREQAWRLAHARQLADREAINRLWREALPVRTQIATNAGFGEDYRAYRWQELLRFDYTPANCERFHRAIEAVVVPAAERLYERHRRRLGLDHLRPWDLTDGVFRRPPNPPGTPPLRPFVEVAELVEGCQRIFERVEPRFGAYFRDMRSAGLLDLDSRKNKAPGGYLNAFLASRQPFIFMNAVGVHTDVQTLLHEGGHAFHFLEAARLPYIQQQRVGYEFSEVASMGMELLAAPYLVASEGGFYASEEAARARVQHLENGLLFWPYMAVVDAFQHWVYTHPAAALNPDECDAQWAALWARFMRGVDWSGLDDVCRTGWQRKAHIHQDPFYYIEYGLAQLGAVQVWSNALKNQAGAVERYRQALALGGTAALPELYAAAGARFAFDADTLGAAVNLMETTISQLEGG